MDGVNVISLGDGQNERHHDEKGGEHVDHTANGEQEQIKQD